jgi:hypothetical protein
MGNMNTYELLRLLLLGGFAGFAVFSISYGLVVWSRRNKSAGGNEHALASIGSVLGAIGIAASLSGLVQAKLLTYTGLIESAISASDQADLEARARLGALSTVPLRIDPALTLRQSQLRILIDQFTRPRWLPSALNCMLPRPPWRATRSASLSLSGNWIGR